MKILSLDWRRFLLIAVNGLLPILLVYIVINQSKTIFSILKDPSYSHVISKKSVISAGKENESSITTWHLFGAPKTVTSVKENTSWVLLGIITGAKDDDNRAIIASSDQDEAIYQRGDKLDDGAMILKILSDQVLLTRNGKMEALLITWPSENQSSLSRPIEAPISRKNDDY